VRLLQPLPWIMLRLRVLRVRERRSTAQRNRYLLAQSVKTDYDATGIPQDGLEWTRGRIMCELSSSRTWNSQNCDCLLSDVAAGMQVCARTTGKQSGSAQTGHNGSLLDRR